MVSQVYFKVGNHSHFPVCSGNQFGHHLTIIHLEASEIQV